MDLKGHDLVDVNYDFTQSAILKLSQNLWELVNRGRTFAMESTRREDGSVRQWRRGSADTEAVASSEWRTTRRCPPKVTNDPVGTVEYIWSGQSELKSLGL